MLNLNLDAGLLTRSSGTRQRPQNARTMPKSSRPRVYLHSQGQGQRIWS